jgi:ribosomal protein S19
MLYVKHNNKSTSPLLSKPKTKYYSTHLWRLMFLINSNTVYNTLTKKIYNNSSSIPLMFIGYEVFIYSGLKWLSRIISKWSVGLRFGVLSWNRKLALYKFKQLKKK